ncbi:MAG: S8 family serine peptidase [Chlorobia bacterium]|nr:S8 family serine peptidase [Fimbriimonadaceae bacterium]
MSFNLKLLAGLAMTCLAGSLLAQTAEFVPGEVLVKFRGSGATPANASLVAHRAIGAQKVGNVAVLDVERVKLPTGMNARDGVEYYQRLLGVEYVELNYKKKSHFVPNDPQLAAQYGPTKMKAQQAWDLTKGNPAVIVAVIDDGADANHEDLKNKLVPGFDYSDGDPDTTPSGTHGTLCAGNVAAETNNAKGIAGMGFNCRIMPIKIFPESTVANSSAAIIHAANNGARVISMSYGGPGESVTERNAVNFAWGKGCVLVSSVGNDGITQKNYPAAFPNVIAVGSTGTQDIRSGFSNIGADWVDVAAPGEAILSTLAGGGYSASDGTSFSCPLVAGVASLVFSAGGAGLTNTQVRNAIETTTDPVPGNFFKFGRVNAFRAVSAVDSGSVTVNAATNVSSWFGLNFTGSSVDLLSTDLNFATVTSVTDPLGHIAGVIVDLSYVEASTTVRAATAAIEANGPSGSSGQVFLWDFVSSKFVLPKSFAINITGNKRQKITLPTNLSRYVSGGQMRLGIRAIGPNRKPRDWKTGFDLNVGFVQVETRPQLP